MALRLASWNVNGIRSCLRQGFEEWLAAERIDIACLQEVKAAQDVLGPLALNGYTAYWNPAEKAGYSGTAFIVSSRVKVVNVTHGIGVPEIDREGRVQTLETTDFILVNIYAPHSQRELARLGYKLDFCKALNGYLKTLQARGKPLVFTGDLNVAHKEIDLANPKANKKNAGFLPEERAWMDELESLGYTDVFRRHCAEPGHYTWWSQRVGVREKNIGWRIDYFMADTAFMNHVTGCHLQPQQRGSDHCPVILDLSL